MNIQTPIPSFHRTCAKNRAGPAIFNVRVEANLRPLVIFMILVLATSAFSASVKLNNVVLYQPDAVLRERLGDVTPLAEYIKKVKAISEPSFNSDGPECLDIVIVLKPGGKARVWFSSTLQNVPDRTEIKKAIEAISVPLVKQGPVAFALSYNLNGIERKKQSDDQFQPPIPEEWKIKAKNIESPLMIPDDFIPLIWPDQ
jgi:hypothetical protein